MTKPLLTFTPMLLLLCVVCLPLTSCGTYDPDYNHLASQIDSSPRSSDIVGIWNQQHDPTDPIIYNLQYNRSVMFRDNGSGEWYYNRKTFLPMNIEKKGSFNWVYKGSGLWTTGNILSGWNLEFRITKDKKKLLLKMVDMDGTVLAVFYRD